MQNQLTKLIDRLRDIDSSNPTLIRTQLLETLRDFIPSDAGLFVKCVQIQADTPYFTSVVCIGDPEFREAILPYAERPAMETPWLPPNLEPDEINTFVRARERYDRDHMRNFRRLRDLFEGLDVHDQLRTVLTCDNRLLGWLGLIRRGNDHSFSVRQERLLDEAVPAIKDNLLNAEALEAQIAEASQSGVFHSDGEIDCLSTDMETWLTPDKYHFLRDRIIELDDRNVEHHAESLDGAKIDILRLHSSDDVRYLIRIERPQLLTIDPSYWLTERQREVAHYVMSGATSPEIAEQLHVSAETVKSHIKNIFERLDISSRAELATKLSGGSPTTDPD